MSRRRVAEELLAVARLLVSGKKPSNKELRETELPGDIKVFVGKSFDNEMKFKYILAYYKDEPDVAKRKTRELLEAIKQRRAVYRDVLDRLKKARGKTYPGGLEGTRQRIKDEKKALGPYVGELTKTQLGNALTSFKDSATFRGQRYNFRTTWDIAGYITAIVLHKRGLSGPAGDSIKDFYAWLD